MRITGSTVLLTGVTGGIGLTLARTLAAKGAKLVVTGRREDALKAVADELGARAVLADLADAADVARLAAECAGTDILIANAALPSSGDLLDYTPEQIDRSLAVNLRAPIMLARLLAPRMVDAGQGHIALIGSISGKAATKSSSLYNATKFGLRGFALAFRQDLHGTGVGVSLIQPGYVRDAGMFAATGAKTPAGARTVSPVQVARGVIRAVERNQCEVNVAPAELKALVAIAGQFPAFSERVQSRAGVDGTVRSIVEAQRKSR
ncbi:MULTISPECIES: SDR family NAD(P)-dependent oxidoreductase [unclassified Streptomyces]|uniref:SDR family NAD(P)-dependent oxidoreductase n=1 Tax=unclassified Streptomyces TaxID=2593676 RepID=UPI002E165A82|nr:MULTISPECIES: SDR family NAD(P)-dependent oxidoreductase [unclassified Streptomyces]WSR24227.1 SDR family NAD(P)-dependent oxidoreductase [Streptomyces sp. NBC_01205]